MFGPGDFWKFWNCTRANDPKSPPKHVITSTNSNNPKLSYHPTKNSNYVH